MTGESAPIISQEEALELALEALDAPSTETAEHNYKSIVLSIEARHGQNQKEVAGELQRIAKEIENQGRAEAAMEFKQRTTEMMLKISMERRHRDRPQANATSTTLPAAGSAQVAPSLSVGARRSSPMNSTSPTTAQSPYASKHGSTASNLQPLRTSDNFDRLVYLVHTTSAFDSDLNLYSRVMGGRVDWAHDSAGKRARALRLEHEPVILLVESDTLPRLLPIFAVNDPERAAVQLIEQGYSEKEKLTTPRGQASIFRAQTGITIGIIR